MGVCHKIWYSIFRHAHICSLVFYIHVYLVFDSFNQHVCWLGFILLFPHFYSWIFHLIREMFGSSTINPLPPYLQCARNGEFAESRPGVEKPLPVTTNWERCRKRGERWGPIYYRKQNEAFCFISAIFLSFMGLYNTYCLVRSLSRFFTQSLWGLPILSFVRFLL